MGESMTRVKPGNALRLVAIFAQPPPPTSAPTPPPPSSTIVLPNGETVTIFGTLYNPPGPIVVIMHSADGTQTILGTASIGSTGVWYIDAPIPLAAWAGIWSHRWYQQGVAVDSNFLQEHTFEVTTLDF